MTTSPTRYRLVHESRAEHVLSLPASMTAVAELLDAARSQLHSAGRSLSDATVHLDEGELVVSYQVDADTPPDTPARTVVGFQ
ncbi:hypothetical protein [Streptomyces nigrescens]|uniref:hypothetical protein n=1 Tax=Streptomyces nigrescens TaxID=1920 RepID=UPI0022533036|nr:hypothetical protein [Streptomyces libani]MCX5445985.1 hypothetical protein [Streptomyces libani]